MNTDDVESDCLEKNGTCLHAYLLGYRSQVEMDRTDRASWGFDVTAGKDEL